jgi:hypothetical protein
MKAAFAILFSALMVLGQTAFSRAEVLSQSKLECARCDCGGKCCVTQSSQAPAPAPAAPAPNAPLKQFQFAPVPAAEIYLLPELAAPSISFVSISLLKLDAVPLYERNCAYLI